MVHSPVNVITVEREYGSRGGEFAHDLAKHLGWRLLDSELVAGAARMAGVDPKLAAELDERLDPWYYRYGKAFWQDPVYAQAPSGEEHVLDSARMLELIRKEILDAAHQGNCVLVGRGAACALAGKRGCFHIFVYATASAKKDWFAHKFPHEAQEAEQKLAAFDRRRAAVIRKFYQQEWCSRGLYHMLLNSCIGTTAMIDAVQCAAGLCAGEPEKVAGVSYQMDSEFRDLDTREKDLLEKLLEATTCGRDELRTQLDHVQAKQIEDDGTLLLQCNGGTEVSGKHAPVADGVCKDADGVDIALILHLGEGGFKKMLEIIKYDGSPILNPPSAQELVLLMPEDPGQEPAENAGNAQ